MNRFGTPDDDHQPVMWLGGYAVYAAQLIALVFAASVVVTTLTMFFNIGLLFTWLPFNSELVLGGQVWRVLTYGLVNPPSLQLVFDLLFIAWFGREVEKFMGRRKFLWLYAGVYLVTPLLFTLIGLWVPMQRAGEIGAFALFIAFATLYPNAVMMFDVLAKWAALILVGIFTLMALAYHDSAGLIALWGTCGWAYAYVRHEQGAFALPSFRFWQRKPNLRVLPDLPAKPAARSAAAPTAPTATMAEIDGLLDKIARSGLASLTEKERTKLNEARADMMKKSAGR